MLAGVRDLNQQAVCLGPRVAPVAVCVTGVLIVWLVSVSFRKQSQPTNNLLNMKACIRLLLRWLYGFVVITKL